MSIGRALNELSRKGRRLGHAMLANNWESLKVQYFTLRHIGKYFTGVTLMVSKLQNLSMISDRH